MKTDLPQNKDSNLLSEKAVNIWRIRATILLILFSFIDGALLVFLPIMATILGVAALIVYLSVIFIYCPALYRVCGYAVNKNIIIIENGLFFHYHTKINFSKVQYCVISQGPVQKIYGVCSLTFLTAGSSEKIIDISVTNAQKIKISVEE
ncbi:MAG: PH domain-containing protein [Clostridia bacterium]|nr:PH domain-containing protein [Clostridia bacterium]